MTIRSKGRAARRWLALIGAGLAMVALSACQHEVTQQLGNDIRQVPDAFRALTKGAYETMTAGPANAPAAP